MVVKYHRRKFDDDADWLPQKDRLFVLKQPRAPLPPESSGPTSPLTPAPAPVPLPTPPLQKTRTTNKEGLDRAYKSESGFYRDPEGTLHMAGTRGGFLESDWIENYKTYGPGLIEKLRDLLCQTCVRAFARRHPGASSSCALRQTAHAGCH